MDMDEQRSSKWKRSDWMKQFNKTIEKWLTLMML